MTMNKGSALLISACFIGLMGCSQSGETSSTKLVGGTPIGQVSGGYFPSTVNMNGSCTGSKIGPRHFLFAAHCAFDFTKKSVVPAYVDNASFALTNAPYPAKNMPNTWIGMQVEHTHFTNSFWNACTSLPCNFSSMITKGADLAIVKVKNDTPDIPVVPVNFDVANEGDWAVLNGYGCEEGRTKTREQLDPNLPWGQLKYFVTSVDSTSLLSNLGAAANPPEAAWNFFTKGQSLDPAYASVCPGDSGGPVYGWKNDGYAVIGVNSAQTSWDSSEISVVNIHARLSTEQAWVNSVLAR